MNWPKISVITPSYNQADFIEETIKSVLSQNYPNLEYWVIDGGSTDGTVDILKKYNGKINWISKKDKGQTHAINKGLKKSTGDILAYLNSDDIYLPDTLRKVGEYYSKNKSDWITGDCLVIDENGNKVKGGWLIQGYKRLLMALYSRATLMVADSMIPQPSTFWSRRAYEKVGDFNEKYNYVMDYDYWLRLSKYYRPRDLKVPLSGFRAQPASKSETGRVKLMAEGDIALIDNGANGLHLSLHRFHSAVVRAVYNMLK